MIICIIISMGSTFKIVNYKERILNCSHESLNFNTYLLALILTDQDYLIKNNHDF